MGPRPRKVVKQLHKVWRLTAVWGDQGTPGTLRVANSTRGNRARCPRNSSLRQGGRGVRAGDHGALRRALPALTSPSQGAGPQSRRAEKVREGGRVASAHVTARRRASGTRRRRWPWLRWRAQRSGPGGLEPRERRARPRPWPRAVPARAAHSLLAAAPPAGAFARTWRHGAAGGSRDSLSYSPWSRCCPPGLSAGAGRRDCTVAEHPCPRTGASSWCRATGASCSWEHTGMPAGRARRPRSHSGRGGAPLCSPSLSRCMDR